MHDDHNPFKDLFPNVDFDRLQDDTINLISSLAREGERSFNALVDCFQESVNAKPSEETEQSEPTGDTFGYGYECPYPERQTVPTDDVCTFPDEEVPKDYVDVEYVEVEEPTIDTTPKGDVNDTMNPKHPIDPFAPLDSQEPPKDQPLTDREVIDKTSSMWKYNPIADSLERYPETVTQCDTTPYATVLASRVRGKKHKHNATNCDDYYQYALVGDSCVVSVADGAGSKAYSRIGAKGMTTQYVAYMSQALESLQKDSTFLEGLKKPTNDVSFNGSCSRLAQKLQESVSRAYDDLLSTFKDISQNGEYSQRLGRELTLSDLACTALSAVIIPLGEDTLVATLQVGDGLICAVDRSKPFDSAVKILGTSDSGNFGGETEFITTEGMAEHTNLMRRVKVMKGKTSAIVLTTDGVADDYYPNDTKACNLYNDLVLNGIIKVDVPNGGDTIKIVPPIREQTTIEEYPSNVCIAYSEDIEEFFGIDDATLWNDRSYLENAVSVYSQCYPDDIQKNLERWLDNYTQRGSFDDRTLFIYLVK